MGRELRLVNAFDTPKILIFEPLPERYRVPANATIEITSDHDFYVEEIKWGSGDYLTLWVRGCPDYDDTRVVTVDGVVIDWF